MDILVILEDSNGELHRMIKEAIVGAQKIGGSISALAMGMNADYFAEQLKDIDISEVNLFVEIDFRISFEEIIPVMFSVSF